MKPPSPPRDRSIVANLLEGTHPGQLAATLSLSVLGGLAALWIGIPAPLLIGGIVTVGIASFFRFDTHLPNRLVNVAFVIVGLLLGSNVSEDTLALVGQWPFSMVGVAAGLVVMVGLTTLLMMRVFKLDPTTAYLCSVPGHLSMVMSMAVSGIGDAKRIVTIQSVRILFLTLLVPLLAMALGLVPEHLTGARVEMSVVTLVVLSAIAVAAGLILMRVQAPAPMVIGPMLVSVAGKLAGLYHGVLPQSVAAVGLIIIGAQIGGRMARVTLDDLKRDSIAGIVMTLIMVGITALVALGLSLVMDMPLGQIWLGLAPGGLDAIGALGLALGYDTAFIAAHQTWRLIILGVAIPLGPVLIRRRQRAG
ncbi:MAG: AbrB family transcriptional regulator [Hyphomicrobiaceae bacterium]|nr:AbrB family transcriptional regulator [Hyphomicrobiaceae bacterium]